MPEVIKTKQQISWLDAVDEKGVVIDPRHELYGQSVAGKELHFHSSSGSTVGPDRIIGLAKNGYAPAKMVIEKKDPLTIWGAIFGKIPLEIKNQRPKAIDRTELEKKNIPEDILELLLKASEYLEFEKFIPVTSTQIAGVSYKTIKDVGLEMREHFSGKYKIKKSVTATLNPAGMDLEKWEEQKIPNEFAEKQKRIIENYEKLGAVSTCTCTPYLTGYAPLPFTNVFLSESSVVSYVNSVLGARTNRESGLSSLLYAIAGWGPLYGLHLGENRNPKIKIEVDADFKTTDDSGTLGHKIGSEIKGKIPYLSGIKCSIDSDDLKSLGAAAAASGSVALYHIENVTPEARLGTISLDSLEEKLTITREDLIETKSRLNTGNQKEIDLVAFGCPHASCEEIIKIAGYLSGKKLKADVDLWVCTARATKAWSDRFGYTDVIEKTGGKVYCDTCMVVAPIEDVGYRTTATNSAKAAHYLPGFCKQKVVYDSAEKIIEMVTK